MKTLHGNGIIINGRKVDVRLNAIICDAPARAYLTLTKSHSGYFGCSKCIQEGKWDGYVNFPEITLSGQMNHSKINRTKITI